MPFGAPLVALRLLDADEGSTRDVAIQTMLDTRLLGFTFSDHAQRKDLLKLRLRNDDYQLYAEPGFAVGQKVEVAWGWPGQMSAPRRMIIKGIKDEGGEVTVWGHCTLSLLDQHRCARFMAGVTDAEWVRLVAAEYGYVGALAHIEETALRHDISQPRWATDAQQLRHLAQDHHFVFYIDETGLHWHARPSDRAPVREFYYRTDPGIGTLLEPPRFEVNLAKAVTRVRVVSLDPVRKILVEQTAGLDDEGRVSLGLEDEIFAPDDRAAGLRGARLGSEEILTGGLCTPAEALERATAHYRETAAGRYRCELRILGDPGLGAKRVIGLWGEIPPAVAGLYHVDEAVTEIGPGAYTMQLKCTKDARLETPATSKRPRANVNQQVMDFTGGMQTLLTAVVDTDGSVVPAWMWTDDGGRTGQTSLVTAEEWAAFTTEQREAWRYVNGYTSLPDS